jgi:preprotein translocase subunit SecG
MNTNKLKLKATLRYVGRYLLSFLIFAALALTAAIFMVESRSGALTKLPTSAHAIAERFMDVMLAVSALVFLGFFIFITVQYLMDLYQANKER